MALLLLLIVISISLPVRSDQASMDIVQQAAGSSQSSGLTTACPPCEGLFPRLGKSGKGERVHNTDIQLRGGEYTITKPAL